MAAEMKKTLCVIPVRGGSKGLPGKNLRSLGGRPLLAWACAAAKGAAGLSKTIVSTDDPQLAALARQYGAEVPFMRAAELAADNTPVVDVLKDALQRMEALDNTRYDRICLLQATSPFVLAEDIERALALAEAQDADTVLTVYDVGQKHPEIMLTLEENGRVKWFCDARQRMARRQDLPPVYARSGLVYVVRRDVLMERGSIYGESIYAITVDATRALSIDNEADLATAAALLEQGRIPGASSSSQSQSESPTRDFETSWKAHRETSYVHWTGGEPKNQIQLAFRQHWELFSELVGRKDGKGFRCLEVGCGRGSLSCYFAAAGYDCTLLDNAPSAIEQARRNFAALQFKGQFDVGDALKMPYADNSFDVIFSIGLLEHFSEIDAPLREQVRVLKKGGTLFVYVVPEKRVLAQEENEWINRLLHSWPGLAAAAAKSDKHPLCRTAFDAATYVRALKGMGVSRIDASGVYPLPMISLSPGFPFTLLPDPCEAVVVAEFQRRLTERRRQTGKNPWLCPEEEGQAFLVWVRK